MRGLIGWRSAEASTVTATEGFCPKALATETNNPSAIPAQNRRFSSMNPPFGPRPPLARWDGAKETPIHPETVGGETPEDDGSPRPAPQTKRAQGDGQAPKCKRRV